MAANGDADESPSEHLCVAQVPIFQDLDRDDQRFITQLATPVQASKGQLLYGGADPRSQLMVVHTGAAKVSRLSPEGREQVLRIVGPGDFIGETEFLTGLQPPHIVTALGPTSMCTFAHSVLPQLVSTHPSIATRMLQTLASRLAEVESRLAALVSTDVTARLAAYLLSQPASPAPKGMRVRLNVAKKDIASLLDTTAESLSRQLRKLEEAGIITSKSGAVILIRDVDALMALAWED